MRQGLLSLTENLGELGSVEDNLPRVLSLKMTEDLLGCHGGVR